MQCPLMKIWKSGIFPETPDKIYLRKLVILAGALKCVWQFLSHVVCSLGLRQELCMLDRKCQTKNLMFSPSLAPKCIISLLNINTCSPCESAKFEIQGNSRDTLF